MYELIFECILWSIHLKRQLLFIFYPGLASMYRFDVEHFHTFCWSCSHWLCFKAALDKQCVPFKLQVHKLHLSFFWLIINGCLAKWYTLHWMSLRWVRPHTLSTRDTPSVIKARLEAAVPRKHLQPCISFLSAALNRKHAQLEPQRPPVCIKFNLTLNSESISVLTRLLSH